TTSLLASTDTSATDAALRDMCQSFYARCVANGVTTTCGQLTTTCTATVGEYNACLSNSVDALGVLPPCSSATRASVANSIAVLAAQPTSAVCMTLEAKCPGSTM